MKYNNILFVNFDIGFNLGYIPEYIIEKYENIILYNIFFKDSKHVGDSFLFIYKNKVLLKKKKLFTFKSNFPVFTIFSYIFVFFNILIISIKHKINLLISPNPIFIFFGNILKLKTLYIVGDIMRLNTTNIVTIFFSNIIQIIIKSNIKNSKYIWFISLSLMKYFGKIKTLNKPICQTLAIKEFKIEKEDKSSIRVIYIGSFDESKGTDLIKEVAKKLPNIDFILIGDKNDYQEENITIYKTKINSDLIDIISKNRFIGIAPYKKPIEDFNYLGDPTKVKQYLSYKMPVITTKFIEFSNVLDNYGAGISIDYSINDLQKAILEIYNNYDFYEENVSKILIDSSIDKIYPDIFRKII